MGEALPSPTGRTMVPLAEAEGLVLGSRTFRWTADDVILYNLAVGAGADGESDLRYCYEVGLEPLPTFGVLAANWALAEIATQVDFAGSRLLHGEHELEVARALPARGAASTTARVAAVYDKGSSAVVVVECETSVDGGWLMTNRFSAFARDAGGFGGSRGPSRPTGPSNAGPRSAARFSMPTLPQQALLYRLCGDRYPLHVDPVFAREAGFERPILHGLCTLGIVVKGLVDRFVADPSRVRNIRVRFGGVVYPGESLDVSSWQYANGEIEASVRVCERDTVALSSLLVTFDSAQTQTEVE